MDPRGGVFRISEAASKARFGLSKLPKAACRVHHMANNLAASPATRLLHVGGDVSYVLWGNAHVKAHWIDEDFESSPERPDVHPYDLVVVDASRARPRVLVHHADRFANEVVLFVPGWGSSAARNRVDRELARLHRWDVAARLDIRDPRWGDGAMAAVLTRSAPTSSS